MFELFSYLFESLQAVSIRWMPPEVLDVHRRRVFQEKSDVWSFGLVMMEMFSEGQDPFPNISDDEINAELIEEEVERMDDPFYPKPKYSTQKM